MPVVAQRVRMTPCDWLEGLGAVEPAATGIIRMAMAVVGLRIPAAAAVAVAATRRPWWAGMEDQVW